jgi:glyoxylase-like metal-dependent hydrolase (beta-lactamase superfamily II)
MPKSILAYSAKQVMPALAPEGTDGGSSGPFKAKFMNHISQYRNIRRQITSLCLLATLLATLPLGAQTPLPDWCRTLPRPEYKSLQRVTTADPWFEVYRVAPGTFALYEPHQSEETISYLILGSQRALLFDTGMGIANIRRLTAQLTNLPVTVLNSHTHNDHVGGNYLFDHIDGLDTDFTRHNALGSRADAQSEITPGQICGPLPPGFDPVAYQTHPWKITTTIHDGDRIDLGGRTLTILSTPGHTPDALSLLDPAAGLLFTGDTYYPGTLWLYRPETDPAAYAHSIQRLAALAPHLKMVLGAHNVPIAPPSVLPQLVAAFDAVRAGHILATPVSPGKVVYKVGSISFLMRAPDTTPRP